jgi:PPOX class probable FMN-dependent enzyme
MHITTLQALRAIYKPVSERALKKEIPELDAHALQFIGLSPFVVLASGGPHADLNAKLDASPRGGEPGFVKVLDAHTLLIPDSPGNNRLDTLENIVATGQLGLLFLVPGFDETLRVNGRALLSTDAADVQPFAEAKRPPALVIRVTVEAAYLHCAKALMRSQLWDATRHLDRTAMPTMGEMLRDQIQAFKGETIDIEPQAQMLERYRQSL